MNPWPPLASPLHGPTVTLEPMTGEHLRDLQTAVQSGRLWENPFSFVPHPDDMESYLRQALQDAADQKSLPYVVRLNAGGRVIGSTRFHNIPPRRRRMEIGFTWYAQDQQRTWVNTECKLLLLSHAFDELSCMAIEWLVHPQNMKSREAVLKLGAKFDGLLRNFVVMADGAITDMALYSVINTEWPTIKENLIARMARLRG